MTLASSVRNLVRATAVLAVIAPFAAMAADDAPGVSATEIKIGATFPFSGPASALGNSGKALIGYVSLINDKGGINGRKINYIAFDDAYSPPKAVEHMRRLVESEEIAFAFSPLGTPSNSAIVKYLNAKHIPHVSAITGASKFANIKEYPYTTMGLPSFVAESKIYAKYIAAASPNAKIAILYQNDDFGKDFVVAFKEYFKDEFAKRVVTANYETSDPSVDSQVVTLKSSNADVFLIGGTPKFAAQAIRRMNELQWKPTLIVCTVGASIANTIQPVGPDKAIGLITASFFKDPNDPLWKDDPGIKSYKEFMAKYLPGADLTDINYIFGALQGQILEHLLTKAGNDLSRENIAREAHSLNFAAPLLLPGITISTGSKDNQSITRLQLQRWNGTAFEKFGDILTADDLRAGP